MGSKGSRLGNKSAGAALVEFSLTVILFLVLVFGIIEFAILMMDMSRANELTRELARTAVVNDPVCNIYDGSCPGGAVLTCPGGPALTFTLDNFDNGCPDESTACRMLDVADAFLPLITPDEIQVSYACSGAGSAVRPRPIPLVTVSLNGYSHAFLLPGLLGLDTDFNFPAMESSRMGEDMSTGYLP